MKGYASIGATYYLREESRSKGLIWSVIENNTIENTSTLIVVEDCPENGKKVAVDAKWLFGIEPIGPIMPPDGEIVVENGIEFIRPKTQSKVLSQK